MIDRFRLSALSVMMLSAGLTSASGLTPPGEYTTRIAEDRLFVESGRVLRCDLFFSVPGKETIVAPKGSELEQSLPPVVWQYSGLLPISDYLKTAAIHSVGSAQMNRSWQDVQHTFYDGLRVEGASEMDAKIAYAGAYAFAPRWPLIELIEVEESEPAYPNTILYTIDFMQAPANGLTLADYRALSLRILKDPENISIEDIQGVIDAADNKQAKSIERGSLGGIGGAGKDEAIATAAEVMAMTEGKSSSPVMDDAAKTSGILTGDNGVLVHGDNQRVAKVGDELVSDQASVGEEPVADIVNKTVPADVVTAEEAQAVDDAQETQAAMASDGIFGAEIFEVMEGEEIASAPASNDSERQATGVVAGVTGAAIAVGATELLQSGSDALAKSTTETADDTQNTAVAAAGAAAAIAATEMVKAAQDESGEVAAKETASASEGMQAGVAGAAANVLAGAAAQAASAQSAADKSGDKAENAKEESEENAKQDESDEDEEGSEDESDAKEESGDDSKENAKDKSDSGATAVQAGAVAATAGAAASLIGSGIYDATKGEDAKDSSDEAAKSMVSDSEVTQEALGVATGAIAGAAAMDENKATMQDVVTSLPLAAPVEGTRLPVDQLFYDDSMAIDADMRPDAVVIEGDQNQMSDGDDVVHSEVAGAIGEENLQTLEGPLDEWVLLPDGTLVLRSIDRLVTE